MQDFVSALYPYVFYGTVLLLMLAEMVRPLRPAGQSIDRRWPTNIGLYLISLVLQRLIAPASALLAAEAANADGGAGLLGFTPMWLSVVVGVLLLDLWKYIEHRLLHRVAILWRMHVVHHSDTQADFTTTERHHPLETIVGAVTLSGLVYLLDVPAVAVALYVLLASPVALFSHANVRLGTDLERRLRWFVATPNFHAVHHSAERVETDSNYGVLLTLWDRLFATYRVPTTLAADNRTIGLEYFRDVRSTRLDRVLMQPFLSFETSRADAAGQCQADQTGV